MHDIEVKTHESLIASIKEQETLTNEEEILLKEIEELEKKNANRNADIRKNELLIKEETEEIKAMTLKLQSADKRIAFKEREYNQQKSSNEDHENLAMKHQGKYQELDQLQKIIEEKGHEYDLVQAKILKKTDEVKDLINYGKDIIGKIRLESSLPLEEFPELSVTDFHSKTDIINKYKVNRRVNILKRN